MATIKNIIFDFGNVLYDIDFERMNTAFKNLGVTDFESHFGFHHAAPLFLNIEQGFITPEQFCNDFKELSGIPLDPQAIIAAWKTILIAYEKKVLPGWQKIKTSINCFCIPIPTAFITIISSPSLKEK